MSRFRKLSHVLWHCQYHLVWVPKYRYKILDGKLHTEVERCIRIFCEQKKCEIAELNIQEDHVHLIVMMPPKVSVSDLIGCLKGRTAIRIFKQNPKLKTKLYWRNHFWAPGYCVDTIGLDEDMIRKYVRYQEKKEREAEQLGFKF